MTASEFLHLYGKSIYQVRLELIMALWSRPECVETDETFKIADRMCRALLQENEQAIINRFTKPSDR